MSQSGTLRATSKPGTCFLRPCKPGQLCAVFLCGGPLYGVISTLYVLEYSSSPDSRGELQAIFATSSSGQ